jgi:hypothetical protein
MMDGDSTPGIQAVMIALSVECDEMLVRVA